MRPFAEFCPSYRRSGTAAHIARTGQRGPADGADRPHHPWQALKMKTGEINKSWRNEASEIKSGRISGPRLLILKVKERQSHLRYGSLPSARAEKARSVFHRLPANCCRLHFLKLSQPLQET